MIIKPEWGCSFCTFINDTSQMEIKDVCQMCLNSADLGCYIELNDKDSKTENEND